VTHGEEGRGCIVLSPRSEEKGVVTTKGARRRSKQSPKRKGKRSHLGKVEEQQIFSHRTKGREEQEERGETNIKQLKGSRQ